MSYSLTTTELDNLKRYFSLPDLINNWLSTPDNFQETDEYSVHESLSDLQPGASLLCTSLSVDTILSHYGCNHDALLTLKKLTGQIISHYGQISNNGHMCTDHQDIGRVANDLQKLQDALEAGEYYMPYEHKNIFNRLYSALLIQNAAQLDIARFVADNKETGTTQTEDLSYILAHIADGVANDNPMQR